jgi:hypothetical protein
MKISQKRLKTCISQQKEDWIGFKVEKVDRSGLSEGGIQTWEGYWTWQGFGDERQIGYGRPLGIG